MVDINVFGSCVSRDIFRFTDSNAYQVKRTIGRIPLSSFRENDGLYDEYYEELLSLIQKIDNISEFEKKCIDIACRNNFVDILNEDETEYLVMDLAEERLDRMEILSNCGRRIELGLTPQIRTLKKMLEEHYFEWKFNIFKFDYKDMKEIKDVYSRFRDVILKRNKKIIMIELYLTEKYITQNGSIKKYKPSWEIEKRNAYLKKCYQTFYEVFPDCIKVHMPDYCYGNLNHIWGPHPLHFENSFYEYLAEEMNIITGRNKFSTLEKEKMNQSIENRLRTRVLNSMNIYEIPELIRQIDEMEKIIKNQNSEINRIKRKLKNINR